LLEPDARKRARPVLRGAGRSNAPGLPGLQARWSNVVCGCIGMVWESSADPALPMSGLCPDWAVGLIGAELRDACARAPGGSPSRARTAPSTTPTRWWHQTPSSRPTIRSSSSGRRSKAPARLAP